MTMNGMELSRAYFDAYGRDLIENKYGVCQGQLAAGLVGEGSECFGYDDQFSQDHDFGPGFCIWMPKHMYDQIGGAMQQDYDRMPQEFMGYRRMVTPQAGKRVGVFCIDDFYQRYIGLPREPRDNMEWMRIPESFLATATNGRVFCDNLGEFTRIRNCLENFYPLDVQKKKLAARAAVMAQAGQYNYPRCMQRGEYGAAYLACAEFLRTALSAIYLLNGKYMPFYKWSFRGARELTSLRDAVDELQQLLLIPDDLTNGGRKQQMIEEICIKSGREFNYRGLTRTSEAFLQVHGEELMRSISDPRLAGMHILADAK